MQARMSRSIAIGTIVIAQGVAGWLAFQATYAGTPTFWLLAGGPTLALAVVALVRGHRDGVLGEWLTPRGGDFTLGVFAAALTFAGAYAFAKIVCAPGSPREIWLIRLYLQLGDLEEIHAHSTKILVGIIAVAAAEEIVWRGLVRRLFEEGFGSSSAWILQAFAYAAAYTPTMFALSPAPHAVDPILPIASLGAGLLWGFVSRRSGRLVPVIGAHALFDWAVVVMFRLWGGSL